MAGTITVPFAPLVWTYRFKKAMNKADAFLAEACLGEEESSDQKIFLFSSFIISDRRN